MELGANAPAPSLGLGPAAHALQGHLGVNPRWHLEDRAIRFLRIAHEAPLGPGALEKGARKFLAHSAWV